MPTLNTYVLNTRMKQIQTIVLERIMVIGINFNTKIGLKNIYRTL